MFGLQRANIPG